MASAVCMCSSLLFAILTVLLYYLQLVGGDPSLVLSALVAVGQEI